MKTFSRKDNFVIATISIVIGIVGLSLYYWYFGSIDAQTTSTPVLSYTVVRGNIGNDYTPSQGTSSQKTYINSDIGFTLKYPQETYSLNIPEIFSHMTSSATGIAYDNCSSQKISARGVSFCPIRTVDHGVGMVQVDNEYITKSGATYYSVRLSGEFKSDGTCQGIQNCFDYGMIQKMFEEQVLSTVMFLK